MTRPHRRVPAGRAAAAACIAIVAWLGCATDESCERACRKLDACTLIPSPLGTSVYNCAARCANTGDEPRAAFTQCTAKVDEDSARWCQTDPQGRPRSCGLLAECLAGMDPELLGTGTVQVNATLAAPAEATVCEAASACDVFIVPSAVDELCANLGVTSIESFAQRLGRRWSHADACSVELTSQTRLSGVPAGPATAGFVVEGVAPEPETPPAGEGSPAGTYCYVLYSEPTVVGPKYCSGIRVYMPSSYEELVQRGHACERDASACSDGIDNDGDAYVDCLDAECAAFCGSTEPQSPCAGDAACEPSPDAAGALDIDARAPFTNEPTP